MNNVYFIKNVSSENLKKLLSKLNLDFIQENDFVALKVHFGEKGNKWYVKPDTLLPLINLLESKKSNFFFTDTNTIYTGQRSNAVEHLKLAEEHGFSYNKIRVPIIIADGITGNNFTEVEINLNHFKTAKIANEIFYCDTLICISHFKGHLLFGFGGAIKNLGMGCAARPAKYLLHNSIKPKIKIKNCTGCWRCIKHCPTSALTINEQRKTISCDEVKCIGCGECIHSCKYKVFSIPWDLPAKEVQEKTVEYAFAVIKNKSNKCLYLNFLNNITKNCDCISVNEIPEIKDIGIVAGFDPVATDFASLNIVNNFYNSRNSTKPVNSKDLFKTFWKQIDYNVQLDYAEKIGLGKKEYNLVEI